MPARTIAQAGSSRQDRSPYGYIATSRELHCEMVRRDDDRSPAGDPGENLPSSCDDSVGASPASESAGARAPSCRPAAEGDPDGWSRVSKVLRSHPCHRIRLSWCVHGSGSSQPFRWLRRDNVDEVAQPNITTPLPPDDPMPSGFRSDWVFGAALQEAVLDGFWDFVRNEESIAFFETKRATDIRSRWRARRRSPGSVAWYSRVTNPRCHTWPHLYGQDVGFTQLTDLVGPMTIVWR